MRVAAILGVAGSALALVAHGDAGESGAEAFLEKYDTNKDGAIEAAELEEYIHELTGMEGGFCEPAAEIMEMSGVALGAKANDTTTIHAILANMYPCISKLATAAQVNVTTSTGDSYMCMSGESDHAHEHRRALEDNHDDHDHGHDEHGHEEKKTLEVIFGSKTLECSLQEEDLDYTITGETWAKALGAGAIAALCSLIGALLLVCKFTSLNGEALDDMIAFAVGVLLAAVFIHMLPEGAGMAGGFNWKVSVTFLAGLFLAFAVEIGGSMLGSPGHTHLHAPQDLQEPSIEDVEESLKVDVGRPLDKALITNIIIGDGIHNLTDGFLIGIAFSACSDSALGWVVTAAILAHEIPQEMVDFIILVRAGLSVKLALLANFLSSVTSLLGVVLILALNTAISVEGRGFMLAFGGGLLGYIALSELLPTLIQKGSNKRKLFRMFLVIFGLSVIGLLQLFHPHCEGDGKDHSGHDH